MEGPGVAAAAAARAAVPLMTPAAPPPQVGTWYLARLNDEDRVVRVISAGIIGSNTVYVQLYASFTSRGRLTFRKEPGDRHQEVPADELRLGPFTLTAGRPPPHIAVHFREGQAEEATASAVSAPERPAPHKGRLSLASDVGS